MGIWRLFGSDDWKRVTEMQVELAQAFPRTTRVQRYEPLVADPKSSTRALFEFLGLPFAEQTAAFLRASSTAHYPDTCAVFKDPPAVNRWRSELLPTIRDAIF
jgi:hypothetical protein